MLAYVALAITMVKSIIAKHDQSYANVTGTSATTFPTEIGFGGEQVSGGAPFNAMVDYIGSDHEDVVEMRWLPKNADQDNATWQDLWFNLGEFAPYHPSR